MTKEEIARGMIDNGFRDDQIAAATGLSKSSVATYRSRYNSERTFIREWQKATTKAMKWLEKRREARKRAMHWGDE